MYRSRRLPYHGIPLPCMWGRLSFLLFLRTDPENGRIWRVWSSATICIKNQASNYFVLRKLWASEVLNMKPRNNNMQFSYEIYYHSISKNHYYNYIYWSPSSRRCVDYRVFDYRVLRHLSPRETPEQRLQFHTNFKVSYATSSSNHLPRSITCVCSARPFVSGVAEPFLTQKRPNRIFDM